jgi:hypothetical protein
MHQHVHGVETQDQKQRRIKAKQRLHTPTFNPQAHLRARNKTLLPNQLGK